jgi:hypothetical protein
VSIILDIQTPHEMPIVLVIYTPLVITIITAVKYSLVTHSTRYVDRSVMPIIMAFYTFLAMHRKMAE